MEAMVPREIFLIAYHISKIEEFPGQIMQELFQ